jgi:hypothetical protein
MITREGGSWRLAGADYSRLVDALEAIHLEPDAKLPVPATVEDFPQTGLGFVEAINEAIDAGLRWIRLEPTGLRCGWDGKDESEHSYFCALRPRTTPI